MKIKKLIDFLKEKDFERVTEKTKNGVQINIFSDELKEKFATEIIYVKKIKPKYSQNNLEAGILKVGISQNENYIGASFMSCYHNFIWEEDQEFYKRIFSSNADDIIDFINQFVDKKMEDIITSEMMYTILFAEGNRRDEEDLEDNRLDYLNNYGNNSLFLENCGFNSMDEYYRYLEALEETKESSVKNDF